MLVSSSLWSTIFLILSTFSTISCSQRCGGSIEAGAGVIRSTNYPDGYPASDCVWIIDSGAENRLRIKFQVRDCSGDSLWMYDGNGTVGVPLLGQYCSTVPPTSIDSSGRFVTIKFMSLEGAENNQGLVISYESIDVAQGSRVIWSEIEPSTGSVRLKSVSADPTVMLKPDGTVQDEIVTDFYFMAPSGNWTALETRYGEHELIWSDGLRNVMIKGSMGSDRSAKIYASTSSSVLGVAADWLTGNVYWTDAAYDWIIMHDASGTRSVLIIDEGLDIPTGIAIHPSREYLFWTDSGSRPKVERSNLAGGGRLQLVSTNIVRPSGITIDYETDLVYWVDSEPSYNHMEVCNLEGANRRTLMHTPTNLGLFDLSISGNYIYTTAKEAQKLIVLVKDSGQKLFNLGLQYTPYSIVTYAPDVQPQGYSPCSSNPCSFLCVGGGPNGYTCLCGNGFLLTEDGRTCEKAGTIDPPQYFVASRSKLCRYPINFPDIDSSMVTNFNASCFLEGRIHAVAIAVDLEDGITFFSDFETQEIGMATLRDGAPVQIIMGGVRDVQGLAVDWMTKHLYWTDHARGTIEVSKYDGSYRTTLIKDNVIKPRSIAIDPERKYMFWTEFGPPTQIERASLDGTERVVIMTAPHGLPFFIPTGLAIDTEEQRLYYADLSTRTINKVDYFGNNKRQLLRKNGATFFDVALYKDYILWTEDGGNNGIYASNRHTGEIELVYHNRGEQVYGITTYADTRQKIMHHPCRYQNGGCDQLCLSSSSSRRGFVCVCTLGFYLADNGKSCVSDIVRDNFFLVTDTYRRAIFQVDMQSTTFEPKALFLPSIQNPIAVSFDPIDRKVYWTDVTSKTLSRASLDGNDYQVIARDGIEGPNGIAVDSISRLVYWTDYGTHGISVSHLDGSNRKILIRGLDNPRALVLHPVEGIMFWTDCGDNAVIERAFMDGTERSIIVSGSLVWPNGLTIDYDGNRLYWCDAHLERLETADFHGRGRRLLFTFGRNVHAYDVAVRGQFLYWTDWTMQSVLKMDKDTGSGIATVGPNDYLRPNGIYMVSDDTLPSGDNQCSIDNGDCTGLCLPVGFDRNCTCAEGFQFNEDGTTCVPDQVTECPQVFHNGFVDESCDLRPGHPCDVQCHPGFSPSSDAIICLASGTWDLDVSRICMAVQCHRLETPPHALPGPCSPPYNTGKMCTYSCIAGYAKIGGDDRSMCDEHGEWIGSPIRCERVSATQTASSCNPDLAFLEEPRNLEVADGDLLELMCRVSDQDATLTWFKDGQRLDSGAVNGIYVAQPNQLFIPSFDARHSGHYACVVFSGERECIRSEANITFNPLSYFGTVPVNAYANISEDHRFQCSPKENTWSVVWEKNGLPLVEGNLLIRRGYLYLINIREENEGKYTCVARDQFGRTKGRVHAWLYLTDPPQIDISSVCGTITLWQESKAQTTSSPVVVDRTVFPDVDEPSVIWSSSGLTAAGRGSGRVVGGNTANHGSAPYMVRISEYRPGNAWDPWTFICGATLLDQRWIMTAAHCMFDRHGNLIQKENMNLFFGDYDSDLTEESEKSRQPAEIIVHEDYDMTNFDNDIALIRIDPPLWEFTPYIRPICLAPEVLASHIMETNINGRVTGWGRESFRSQTNRFMKEVELPIVDRQTCEESIDEDEGEFTDNMFCAGYHSALLDACSGDTGGPFAFRHDDGRWYQLGIVSWGVGCAEEGEYGFYTSISRYLEWLRSKNVTVAYSPNVARRFNESQPSEALAFTVRSPSTLTVAAGSVVDLECFPNRDDASVQWFINNRPVRSLEEGVRILPPGLVLHFDAVEDRFSGVYSCEARVDDEEGEQVIRANFQLHCGTQTASSCNPNLAFLEEPQNLEVAEGDLLELRCRVSDPDVTLAWFKDGQRLDSGAVHGIYVDQPNQLFIPSFNARHAGHYACAVFSGERECMRSEANMTFNSRSYFGIVPLNAYVNIGEGHQFQCSPKENTWSVVWEKDGRPLEQGNIFIRRGYLYLINIKEENEGKYTCVARDQFRRTKGRVHAWLYLTDPPQIDISTVCGTITFWKESKAQTTPSPVVVDRTVVAEVDEPSVIWSSSVMTEAGRGSGRVVGGNTAHHGSAPYMVRISEYRPGDARDTWTSICGATLLDQRWILTAATCMFDRHGNLIQKENMNLFFGDYDSDFTEESEKSRQPAEIIVHEDYDMTNFDNDIALIRIDPPLWEFTPYIRPICLAPGVLASHIMQTNMNGRVTGWGRESVGSSTSRFMKEVELPIVDRQTCEESIVEEFGEFTDNMFCAGYHSAKHDACGGDSGGPFAFRHDDGRWYQLGIVSWGFGCAAEGEYGFYTSISRYLHWLRSKNVTVAYSPNVARRSEALAFTVRSPSTLTVAAGSVVDLECFPNRDDASVQWFINNRLARNFVEGVRILPSGLVLHFDAIEDRFSAVYSCEARVNDEEGEQVIRANFQLQVTAA